MGSSRTKEVADKFGVALRTVNRWDEAGLIHSISIGGKLKFYKESEIKNLLTISDKFSMAMAEYAWTSFQSNAKVFEFAPQGNKDRFHPTQKPVMLYKWLLEHYAKKGDKIFDPMMGSGSSRIAAYSMGYDYYGCELDKDYFEAADKRFQKECNGIYYTPKGIVKQLSLF